MTRKVIDPKVLSAALDELRPLCRQVFTLYTWGRMMPMQIVEYLAKDGVAVSAEQVGDLVQAAARHCDRRLNESEVAARLHAVARPPRNADTIRVHNSTRVSEHIWLDDLTLIRVVAN